MNINSLKNKSEDGFTLIELLVVVIIIGILAAIAIPAFLGFQANAREARTESDVRNSVTDILDASIGTGVLPNKAAGQAVVLDSDGTGTATTVVYDKGTFDSSGAFTANDATGEDFRIVGTTDGTKTFTYTSYNGKFTTGTATKTPDTNNTVKAPVLGTWTRNYEERGFDSNQPAYLTFDSRYAYGTLGTEPDLLYQDLSGLVVGQKYTIDYNFDGTWILYNYTAKISTGSVEEVRTNFRSGTISLSFTAEATTQQVTLSLLEEGEEGKRIGNQYYTVNVTPKVG